MMSPAGRSVADSLLLDRLVDGDVAEGGSQQTWRVPSSTVREAVYEAGSHLMRDGHTEAAHERYTK